MRRGFLPCVCLSFLPLAYCGQGPVIQKAGRPSLRECRVQKGKRAPTPRRLEGLASRGTGLLNRRVNKMGRDIVGTGTRKEAVHQA